MKASARPLSSQSRCKRDSGPEMRELKLIPFAIHHANNSCTPMAAFSCWISSSMFFSALSHCRCCSSSLLVRVSLSVLKARESEVNLFCKESGENLNRKNSQNMITATNMWKKTCPHAGDYEEISRLIKLKFPFLAPLVRHPRNEDGWKRNVPPFPSSGISI